MVVVKHGALPHPGKQYKVYLNVDKLKHKWYLRVTHTYPSYNQHFRAGTYKSKEDALKALETLDPTNPKKGRQRKGTVDQYNGQWRVRAKHRGEHMHVGYFKDREKAEQRLKEVIADTEFLEKRYNSLIAKRKRKRESMKSVPNSSTLALLRTKVEKIQRKQKRDEFTQRQDRRNCGVGSEYAPLVSYDHLHAAFSQPCFNEQPAQFLTSDILTKTEVGAAKTEHQWRMQPATRHLDYVKTEKAKAASHLTTSSREKVGIRKRCMNCAKTQLLETHIQDALSQQRLVYFQCDQCKKCAESAEQFDVGWCAPAILSDYGCTERNFQEKAYSLPALGPILAEPLYNPRSFQLKSPINYTEKSLF